MRPIAVLCGGRGTRLRDVTHDAIPKAMIDVGGRPFIDHKLDELSRQGFSDVVLLAGFRSEQIRAHVGDGAQFGLSVVVRDDGAMPLGTGGAVQAARELLAAPFWVTYGDTLLDLDSARAEAVFAAHDWDGLMTVLHNRDRWGTSNAKVVGDRVLAYAKSPPPLAAEHIDYGMVILTDAAFASAPPDGAFGLEVLLGRMATTGRLGAFAVTRRFYEIGTPSSLAEVSDFVGDADAHRDDPPFEQSPSRRSDR